MLPLKFSTSIIWDLDGVLFEFEQPAVIAYAKRDYDAVVEIQLKAKPIKAMVAMARAMALDNNTFIFTARSEKYRISTHLQLKRANIPYEVLFMRPFGNLDPSPTLKLKMYTMLRLEFDAKENSTMIIEDRVDVVDAFNVKGIPALLYKGV